ncbi:MAG: hypothetical protein JWN48_547, partial [Myxococcaceae bacterium]|nr:hypothetical protein [Myxococcaceae bacterium]
GVFAAESEHEALDACSRELGFLDFADALGHTPDDLTDLDLVARELEPGPDDQASADAATERRCSDLGAR